MTYPSAEKIVEQVNKLRESLKENSLEDEENKDDNANNAQQIDHLKLLVDRDPLHELHEQERKTMWALRHYCLKKIPNILAKLLQCVEWNDYKLVEDV